jgi:ACR3 family arsenite transporter
MSDAVLAAPAPIGRFARYLSLWVGLCIVVGIALGQGVPGVFAALARAEIQHVNLPVAGLVWLMIVPMLLKSILRSWRACAISCAVSASPCW